MAEINKIKVNGVNYNIKSNIEDITKWKHLQISEENKEITLTENTFIFANADGIIINLNGFKCLLTVANASSGTCLIKSGEEYNEGETNFYNYTKYKLSSIFDGYNNSEIYFLRDQSVSDFLIERDTVNNAWIFTEVLVGEG